MFFSYILVFFIIITFFLILGLANNLSEKYSNLYKLKKIRKNNNKQEYIEFSVSFFSKKNYDINTLKNSVLFFDKYIKDDLLKFSTDERLKSDILNSISEINKYLVINPSDPWNSFAIQEFADKLILKIKKL